jgi:hypothetical protein
VLVKETKETLAEYVSKLSRACDDIAERQQSSQDTWVDVFQALIDGIDWVISAVHAIQQVDPEALTTIDTNRLSSLFEPLNAALEGQDMILFADIMQYEMKPVFEEFAGALSES